MNARRMKSLSAIAVAVALSLGSVVLAPQASTAAEAQKNTVSKAVIKPLGDAQKALAAKKFDEALAQIAVAEANTSRTPFDTFVMHQLKAATLAQAGRQGEAVPSYIAEIESGFMTQDEADRMSRGVTALLYQNKDYAKAVEFGTRFIATGRADADSQFIVAHSLHYLKRDADSIKVLKDYIADAGRKGVKPIENSLILLTQASAGVKDNEGLVKSLEMMVQYYGKPDYWRDLLVMLRDGGSRGPGSDNYTFNIYRLMRETGTLRESNDFLEMAQLAVQLGSPGEASDVLRRGSAAITVESDKAAATKLQATAKGLEDTDRAGLAKFETEAKAAKAGEGDVRLGQALLSYDQPEKAVEAIQRGIGKGSLRNADEAQILLGIALLRLGKKADAAMAFSAVKGTDVRLGNLARLWGLLARA